MQTSMTIHELAEWVIEQISRMDKDQKAHIRAKLLHRIGRVKTSDKPN